MTRFIILLRHGATGGDNGRKYLGRIDLPLGEEGERQSLRLRQALQPWSFGAVYSSDLARCRRTAEIAIGGRGVAITAREDLREGAMGEWEGRLRSEIAAAYPEECAARRRDIENHRVKGGESFKECQARVVRVLEELAASGDDNVLLVGHGSTNRLLLCHMLGMPIANMFRLGQDHGCMNIVQQDDSGYRLVLLNFKP
ncbi:histidine phosphatase family protein [Telmatospirillum siberiense]|uniref:Alpha-ribazole phosphatase n=1 Tax=Telmatospirillum siberiense TaxID=382514 RepID=A0A2N3PX03_9PROT|nr:histidine phosphatase family protein [Telmatospirillum siberiense]PKU24918.1 alpha-ribazole phosphatase [Telmatospirillum siberiense]